MAEVLVVDDDEDIRDVLALAARRAGHRVTSVSDPGAALAVAQAAHVDLALVGWSTAVESGSDLCARLRALPHLASTPILVVTGHADEETRRRAAEAGASGCLTAPFSLHELDHVVTAQLAARRTAPHRLGA